jgi:hypothetical protein
VALAAVGCAPAGPKAPSSATEGMLLPSVKAKVVIVHGTADELVPVTNVAHMQVHFAGARCISTVLHPGQNHSLPWNAEAVVREALRVALDPAC